MTYAVIGTNVVVASLLTHNHDSATVRVMDAVYSRTVIPLVNYSILAEYADVLRIPHLHLDPAKCEFIISLMTDIGLYFDPVSSNESMPDEEDRVFFEVALAGRKKPRRRPPRHRQHEALSPWTATSTGSSLRRSPSRLRRTRKTRTRTAA